jgi:hypothetical protein
MEHTAGPIEVQRRDVSVVRLTQVGLLIACLGAAVIIFNPFGWAAAGLVLAPVGVVLAARGGFGHVWFVVVAIGAILVIVSRIVAEGAELFGGWLAIIACLMILLGATAGFPGGGDQPE